jgi:hypothetical protein
MFSISAAQLNELDSFFLIILKNNLSKDTLTWLETKAEGVRTEEKPMQLNQAFSQLPKHAGRNMIAISNEESAKIAELAPGFSLKDWTIDRLARVWLLMQISTSDKEAYLKKINGLFTASEMNEQVALYSALPFYSYPEEWIPQAENGIRSNIGTVLEAIMYHNPFAAAYLSENSFNQLVLKAFFTEKDVTKITGLYTRVNKALQDTLSDYVAERTAAHRTVEPNIYHLIELNNQTI